MSTIEVLSVTVPGRPAPQGSKKTGSAGQLREASAYLPAWRAAVKRAVYERYRELGVVPGDLPLLLGPVAFGATFYMPGGHRVDSPPDLDKLLRAVWDSLTAARVWEDDGRVVEVDWCSKVAATEAYPFTGAHLQVRSVEAPAAVDGADLLGVTEGRAA
ncbi:RusA family crossover junction endodeoxyribonuclease [Amycolatopsis jiangsuensis]|uniref:Crossover junction endodeoxyribonuclease RusA n=1 Tax=Amycolatopsis jiangsuensis TaxID=1181879 RepID=A0A840J876_9PSEU|nr:RusA family crossover junction endodeoxyribonuclease [Amycolatopsis jiangsuensis]MBB4689805.1 crossover junction endodeoxyribonuclease RusA [Amycolatopsis jiangsuensis]